MESEQAPVPGQAAPLHPANVEPAAGVAVKVTVVPLVKLALHVVVGPLMPDGLLVIEPEPLPAEVTDNGKVTRLNVAVTDCAAVIFTLQVPVPAQAAPLHPANVEPVAGVAVKVTVVPLVKLALHVLVGQLIPDGLLVIEPEPLPAEVTDNGKVTRLNVAVTDCAAVIFMLHVPVPEQAALLHPAKVAPAAAVAVKVTVVPLAKFALQVILGQLIPAGLLVTVPFPARVTFRRKVFVLQLGNLKLAMRVFQLKTPLVLMYSWVYQKVQSSTGSTCMAL